MKYIITNHESQEECHLVYLETPDTTPTWVFNQLNVADGKELVEFLTWYSFGPDDPDGVLQYPDDAKLVQVTTAIGGGGTETTTGDLEDYIESNPDEWTDEETEDLRSMDVGEEVFAGDSSFKRLS